MNLNKQKNNYDDVSIKSLVKIGHYENFLKQKYGPFLSEYSEGNPDAISILSHFLRYNFEHKLAFELLALARKDKTLSLDGLDLERRVVEWIRSYASPDIELALMLLDSENEIVQNITAAWILSEFQLEERLFKPLLFSDNPVVNERGKMWFNRNRGTLGKFLIKKQGGQIKIMQNGKNLSIEEFPLNIINALLSIPYDVVLEVQKLILDPELGLQLVVEDLDKISDNNIQQLIGSIEKRMSVLDILADFMGWNNINSCIINHKILENI